MKIIPKILSTRWSKLFQNALHGLEGVRRLTDREKDRRGLGFSFTLLVTKNGDTVSVWENYP